MVDSVYNSRKVMLIMFVNYLVSGFCKDEMYMVIYWELVRNDVLLIVVCIDFNIKIVDLLKILWYCIFIDVIS